MAVPQIWSCVLSACGVDELLIRQGWQAVVRARWSVATAFRQDVLAFERRPVWQQLPGDAQVFLQLHMQPEQLMTLLENLVREQQLTRHKAGQIEEALLQSLTADGQWQ
jgi:hypothetical protein